MSGIEHQQQEKTPSRHQPERGFNEKSEFTLPFADALGSDDFIGEINDLNQVHTAGQVAHIVPLVFDHIIKRLEFSANQVEDGDMFYVLILIDGYKIYRGVGINRYFGLLEKAIGVLTAILKALGKSCRSGKDKNDCE